MGIADFMLVHDSYGVHACHVEQLSTVLREEFASLYRQSALAEFVSCQIDANRPSLTPAALNGLTQLMQKVPVVGDLNVCLMTEARYMFS